MTVPIFAHFYEKPPLAGTGMFRARHLAQDYTHRIVARGGFDVASCSLDVPIDIAESIFHEMIGNAIQFYAEVGNPVMPIWEGLVTRITLRTGGAVFTASMNEMANRVQVVYSSADSASSKKTELTATVDTPDSQTVYGIKAATYDAGIHYNAADKSHKTLLRNTLRTVKAWPLHSMAPDGGSGPVIEIECQGFQHFCWDWVTYQNTDATTISASQMIGELMCTSFVNTNESQIYVTGTGGLRNITANATFNIARESRSGQTYLQFIQSIAEAGDGSAQWVFGITPQILGGPRYAYFRPASGELRYSAEALINVGIVRDIGGNVIPGYEVQPDAGIQIRDVLQRYTFFAGDDPRAEYLSAVQYSGSTGLVTYQTGDNITMEGILGKGSYFKPHGKKSGGYSLQPRSVV